MGRILGRFHSSGLTHYFGHYLEQTRYLDSTHCFGEREFRAPLPRSTIPSRILLGSVTTATPQSRMRM